FLGDRLTVTSGALLNGPDGTISSVFNGGGGPRLLAANGVRRVVVTVSWPLELNNPDAAHLNRGTITLSGTTNGVLTVTQTAAGKIGRASCRERVLDAGTTFLITGGSFHHDPLASSGTGILAVQNCTVVGVTLSSVSA